MKVSTSRIRAPGTAECEQCARLHPDSTRSRCRAHVQQTGHTVHYMIKDSTTYKPEGGAS